jgi:hypothetical protein
MLFAWMVFVSTGILLAKFFKNSWTGRKILGTAIWFAAHRGIMLTASLCTIIGFILILIREKGRWIPSSSQREFAHSILGVIVVCFVIIQPIMALFRCAPDHQYRFIFNYAHGFIGSSSFALAIAAIFLALLFPDLNFNREWGIFVGWIVWIVIVFILFVLIEFFVPTQQTSDDNDEPNSYDLTDQSTKTSKTQTTGDARTNSTKDRIQLLLLLIHIVITMGFTLALSVHIGRV